MKNVSTNCYRKLRLFLRNVLLIVADIKMGCFGSKDKLSKEDMDFLKSHTRYDEATIKEWYKGFKVSVEKILLNIKLWIKN